jgi:uncharacterized membrane protein YeaQ/YmgE (transglycosylase-associated protein family)
MTYDYWVIAIGLAIGLAARFVVPGRRPMNALLAMVLGAAGAYGGVHLGQRFALLKPGETGGFLLAAVGAVVVLALFVALFRRGS